MSAILNIKNVGLCFSGQERPILDNINYELFAGESLVILGSNGSGKSSLIKLINRNYAFSQGEIELKQKEISKWNSAEFSRQVVTLSQDTAQSLFYDLTVLENCLLWESRIQKPRSLSLRVLELLLPQLNSKKERKYYGEYLQEYHPKLKQHLDTSVRLLSGGERQALLLALCLKEPPSLLLLDEHTSALDPHQARHIMSRTLYITQNLGITTVMTTHNLEHALEFGERLMAIKDGRIVFESQGPEKQQLTRGDLLSYCY
jgi:putative tryptophan/tyrosine transport system ATP-binding protein